MAFLVGSGATLTCTLGSIPGSLVVAPTARVTVAGRPAATILNSAPGANITPNGMCVSLGNPTVAAATAAAQGVLTPQPCTPVTPGPWSPGSTTVLIAGSPALSNTSQCLCTWGGVITVADAAQVATTVP